MKVYTPIDVMIKAAEEQIASWDLLVLDNIVHDNWVEYYAVPKGTVEPGTWAIRLQVGAHDRFANHLKFSAQPMMNLNGWHWTQFLGTPEGDRIGPLQMWTNYKNDYRLKDTCDPRFLNAIEFTYKNNKQSSRKSEKCRQEFIALSFVLNADKNTGQFKIGETEGRLRKTHDNKLLVDLTISTTSMEKIARVLEILRE